MTVPAVSVLMSVHNGAPWVRDAIASVLAQTERALELIVVDDGSTDDTAAVIAGATAGDRRVRVVRQAHAGLTKALNRALALATAPLVARLDADDVALPERLARQRAFLDAHPDVGLLGSACREVDTAGRELRVVSPPTDDAAIRRALIRRNPFVHSSVMLRRAVVTAAGGYDESLAVAQDYDLWMRLSRATRLANLAEPLVTRRLLPGRVTATRDDERLRAEVRVRWRAVRAGLYPWWCAVFAARAAVALALPGPVRRALRRAVAPAV
ncbi:MAG: glycosyltransferase [Candidatus Rokuibacteriota bacterium]